MFVLFPQTCVIINILLLHIFTATINNNIILIILLWNSEILIKKMVEMLICYYVCIGENLQLLLLWLL